jgi:hypothetical protein
MAAAASALPPTFTIEQIFSNADGSVQFITIYDRGATGCDANENLWAGVGLISTGSGTTNSYVFPTNLSSCQTSDRHVLIATDGFAALGIVTPDYVIPNGFVHIPDGALNFAGVSIAKYTALPNDGVTAILLDGTRIPNLATNFAGQEGSVNSAPPSPSVNYQGLWYKSPAESESGWGINLAHQGDVIFATWFTYDAAGKAWWLTMTANKTADGVYTGQLYRTNGTPFSAFVAPAMATAVGTGTLTFTGATTGTFAYSVSDGTNTATQTKAIVLQTFGPAPTCAWGAQPDLSLATNYQDLWWATGGTESGWGINFTHQGTTIFATWFTYDANHNPLWLSATLPQTAPAAYTGSLVLTGGQAFSAVPFDPSKITRTIVGTATVTFANGNAATFSYNVDLGDGINKATQTKSIARQVFRAPGTACH